MQETRRTLLCVGVTQAQEHRVNSTQQLTPNPTLQMSTRAAAYATVFNDNTRTCQVARQSSICAHAGPRERFAFIIDGEQPQVDRAGAALVSCGIVTFVSAKTPALSARSHQ